MFHSKIADVMGIDDRHKRPAWGFFASVAVVAFLIFTADEGRADGYAEARSAMQQVTDRLLARLHAEEEKYQGDEARLYKMIEDVVLPVIDVRLFSRYALGEYWKSASEPQKQRFIGGFQSMLVKSYGKQLLLLSDIEIEVVPDPSLSAGKKYQIVRTKAMLKGNSTPLSVDYLMMDRGGWKVFDIIIDGTSMIKQFRGSFAQEIKETGFEALLARLDGFDS